MMLSRSLALAAISWVLLLPRDCRRRCGSGSGRGWLGHLRRQQEQSAALWQSVYPLVFPGKSVWWISPGEGRPDQSIGDVSTFWVDLLPS